MFLFVFVEKHFDNFYANFYSPKRRNRKSDGCKFSWEISITSFQLSNFCTRMFISWSDLSFSPLLLLLLLPSSQSCEISKELQQSSQKQNVCIDFTPMWSLPKMQMASAFASLSCFIPFLIWAARSLTPLLPFSHSSPSDLDPAWIFGEHYDCQLYCSITV